MRTVRGQTVGSLFRTVISPTFGALNRTVRGQTVGS
jgi:hypothetical protein